MVKKLCKIILLSLLSVISMLSSLVYGNGATFGGSGQVVFPLNSHDIELSYEQVYIYFNDSIDVDCYFHLKNYGPIQEVQIGFPDNRVIWGDDIRTITVRDLTTSEQPQVTKKDATGYEKVFLWKTKFNSGELKIINVKYSFEVSWSSAEPYSKFGYILKTGALWRGVIKKADFYIKFKQEIPHPCILASPHNYLYTKDRLEWHFNNIEPDFNLEIKIFPRDNEKIYEFMYFPYQADLDDDYLWDEVFYVSDEFAPGEPEKNNPNYVEWVKYQLIILPEIRNEIYARHGYIFQEQKCKELFNKKSWYKPNSSFSYEMFNLVEKRNINYIIELEKKLRNSLL